MIDEKAMIAKAEEALAPIFKQIDEIAERGTERVLTAFKEARVSATMFGSTDGYGYDDYGRDTPRCSVRRPPSCATAFFRERTP